jgi:hypothetical protein
MDNSKYMVHITWTPSRANGQQLVNIAGATQSIPTYSASYFTATMLEVKISATGSTRADALTNLEILAATASSPENPALDGIRTW